MNQRKPGTVWHELGKTPPRKSHKLKSGEVVGGHYVVEEVIDEGGMAVVYRATNQATGKTCALKVLHAQLGDRPEFMQLFSKEAKVQSVIGDNRYIVPVYDAGLDEERGIPFIVMELLEGQTLERVFEHGPLSPNLACIILEQLKTAMGQAHASGVVHRDLKPSNLFLTKDDDGEPLIKVMDFGIAKVLEGEAVRTATQIGTPAYNAPEQMGSTTRKLAAKQGITIAAGVSPATDVWAIGLLAYEMFTGDLPGQYWGVETLSELPMKVAFEEHTAATSRAGRNAALLPTGFDLWFERCMRKNAAERWQDAGEAIDELLKLVDGTAMMVSDEAIDSVSTRLVAPPESEQRLDDDEEAARSARKAVASEPPPLPPVKSPAITVAAGPAGGSKKDKSKSVSSDGPVVKGAERPWSGASGNRQGLAVGMAMLALAAVGLVIYNANKKQGGASGACGSDDAPMAECQSACDSGDLVACQRLGALIDQGKSGKKDEARARALYQRACGVSHLSAESALRAWSSEVAKAGCAEGKCAPKGCVALATLHEQGRGGALKSDRAATALYKRVCRVGFDDELPRGVEGCVGLGLQRERAGETDAARTYYGAACEDGLLSGCVALAAVLQRGGAAGEWRDEKRARELYQKACDGGDLKGCTLLGRMVERGRGGWVKDEAAAVGLYKRACDGHQLLGCVHLAKAHQLGKGKLTRDAVRAVELLRNSCDGGELVACARLAVMTKAGQGGIDKDAKRAFGLNKQACDGGSLRGCAQLGAMFINGEAGLTKDEKEGRDLIERACRGGEPIGCVSLGRLDSGKLTGQELVALFEKACDDGAPQGCLSLAELIETGERGIAEDQERAAKLYRTACDDGSMRACTNLGNMTYNGAGGLERNAKRSVELNDKACHGGDQIGCARLGLLHALGHGVAKDTKRAAELHRTACGGKMLSPEMEERCAMLRKLISEPEEALEDK